jgi:phosphoribosylanthranilate isomerase
VRIKICGLFHEQDIDFVNEARPDYVGFVFAESKRQVSPAFAAQLRRRLSDRLLPVGVFVNAPVEDITALYHENTISIAQLHGEEDDEYIMRLKLASYSGGKKQLDVIKTIRIAELEKNASIAKGADYYLIDSGAGSGKAFNWELLKSTKMKALTRGKPWFLAGGIDPDNIVQALCYNPHALDVSSGAETDGVKDQKKIVQLVSMVRKYALYKRK